MGELHFVQLLPTITNILKKGMARLLSELTHFIRAPLNLLWLKDPGSHLELKRANALACPQMLFSAEMSDIQANEYISQQRTWSFTSNKANI